MKTRIFFTLILLVLITLCFKVRYPSEIEIIGSGYVQSNENKLFVDINAVKYPIEDIYTQKDKEIIKAAEGMLVTVFRKNGNPHVEFVSGECNAEFLSNYFRYGSFWLVCITFVVGIVTVILWGDAPNPRRYPKIVHADL